MPLHENSPERDLAARDLTINALALEENGRLHCHPQALRDLRDGILRPASSSAFESDPLRVFRVARFAAALPRFRLADECAAYMRAVPDEALRAIPAERVGRELLKALAAPKPGRFLKVLDETSCLRVWFPELIAASVVPGGPPALACGQRAGSSGCGPWMPYRAIRWAVWMAPMSRSRQVEHAAGGAAASLRP